MIVLVIDFIGFGAKLLAESIEAADMKAAEAIRAAGGNRFRQMVLGVIPQVIPVWVGIFVYGWDIVLRASFVLGLVGAGGVGAISTGPWNRSISTAWADPHRHHRHRRGERGALRRPAQARELGFGDARQGCRGVRGEQAARDRDGRP
jgi:hypothetical protein